MRYRHLRFPAFRTKAFTMSFDDGMTDDIRLVNIMGKYGLKGTFNISSAKLDEDGTAPFPRRITASEAKDLYLPAGHEVAVHGLRHISPYLSTSPVRIREMLEDRIGLERIFGQLVFGMALPDDGRTTPEMIEEFRSLGFHYCRGLTYRDDFAIPDDFMYLGPTVKFNHPTLDEKLDRFFAADPNKEYISHRDPLLFYMWGHSHELRGQDNWYIIDEVGEKLQGHDEVWLATNGEIVEYVRAWRALESSADGSILRNNTVTTLYMEVDRQNMIIRPGDTLYLD